MKTRRFDHRTHRTPRARTRRRCAPATCSSSPARFRSIPATGDLVDGDIAVQARQVLDNIGAVLKAGGLSLADVVRTTVFLADMNDFAGDERGLRHLLSPSRIQLARPFRSRGCRRDVRIEIDAIAAY